MDPAAAAASAAMTAAAGAGKPSSEQKAYNPNPNYSPNPYTRVSRWSNAAPGSYVDSGSEPPQKKVRNDVSSLSNTGESKAGCGADISGYGEGPPGLAHTPPAASTTAAPSYGVSGYGGTGYGAQQQTMGYQSYGSQYQVPPPAHGTFAPGFAKGTGALFYKTKLCTKFKIGTCTFNERCHFAHGTEDLRKPQPGWESMAVSAGATATVTHGGTYMGQTRPKTRLCRYFADGNCPYGDRCSFLHGNEESRGPYAATGMQGPAVATDLQGYSGVSAHPNGGTVSSSMQYPNPNQGLAAPKAYEDPSLVNSSSLPAPYGVPAEFLAGALGSVAAPKMNPYASVSTVNPYPSSQDGTNGASANYNYWNGPATNPTQGYMQVNQTINQGSQTASWMPSHAADGYSKRENEAAIPQHSQEHPRQQQSVNTIPYVQDAMQNTHQGGITHGAGSYYPGVYIEATYPNQQVDYTTRYNMAEAWGGKIQ